MRNDLIFFFLELGLSPPFRMISLGAELYSYESDD